MTVWSQPRIAFVDTSALGAILHSRDANHTKAHSIFERLIRERWALLTSNFVVAETHALILNRASRQAARAFLLGLPTSKMHTLRVTPEDERRALEIVMSYDDKDFSLTDCTSFAIMERLGIGQAFAFDRNFSQYGLGVLS